MKLFKFTVMGILAVVLFLACTKTDNHSFETETQKDVTIKNGMVNFRTVNDYLNAVENKNGKQEALFEMLKRKNFSSLRKKPVVSSFQGKGNTINSFTNDFDTTLYSEYLLDILNQDKMFIMDSFLVKVDMDNVFCSMLDLKLYPNDTADLRNNNFSNPHINVFLDPNEPVLEVTTQMRDNTITWTEYQDSLARKGGQGICFKSGAKKQSDYQKRTFDNEGDHIVAEVKYNKYFLHFELVANGFQKINWAFAHSTLKGQYEYQGVCKGGGSGTFNINTYTYPKTNPRLLTYVVYSGGSALRVTKLRATTVGGPTGQSTVTANIGY